jgi:bacteriocin biosynthesis cyclodehydratase domain-containing protein
MLKIPAFKSHLHVEVIPGQGVLLLSEDGARALHGKLYELIAPLVDGARSCDDIVDTLSDRADAARIYYALGLLERNGHTAEATPHVDRATAAFWHGLGMDAGAACDAIASKSVRIRAVGSASISSLGASLEELGVTLAAGGTPELEVVVTDDYLRADLLRLNAQALASGRPWLLVKTVGHEPWIGPLFVPGETGCFHCLHQRLLRNRPVHQFVADFKGLTEPPQTAFAALSATTAAASQLAAVEVLKFLGGAVSALQGKVLSLDGRTLHTSFHELVRNPVCPACGEPEARAPRPLQLVSRKATFVQDGGHRTTTPELTLENYQHHVSPITGVVKMLQPVPGNQGIAHVYIAGHNSALTMRGLDFLKQSLRNVSAGKGVSKAQAKTSALCEALERYSGEFTGTEVHRTASFRELAPDAIHPNSVMRFSDQQFAERDGWNARKSKFNVVTEPLDDDTPIDWTSAWSLTEARHKYLPTQLVYFRAPACAGSDGRYSFGCSNGGASGNTLEEAVLQGFLELVERDSVALWWYNRLGKRGVDLASFEQPYLSELSGHYKTLGREMWALDITGDLGIPAFAALSRCVQGDRERIILGLGCHLDAGIALQRAFAELNQMLGIGDFNESEEPGVADEETQRWLRTATVQNQPYLLPDASLAARQLKDFAVVHSGDLMQDILWCQRAVENKGMEMLVLDQTRPDVKMPVVKVIVPGLRHFWARFAPGRLYDVPVEMGWLPKALAESELNPIPIFF